MTKFSLQPSLRVLLLAAGLGLSLLSSNTIAKSSSLDSGQAVFEVLASEIALQRGEAGLAYTTYLELARQLDDPRLAQRAMEIAITAGAPDLALQAAQTWDSLAGPKQTKPKEVLVTLLILNQRWSDAVKPAISLLNQQTPAQRENTLLQIQALLAKATNESEALRAFYEIASTLKPEPKDPGLLYTYAMSAEKSGHIDVMEKTLREILRKNPNDANSLNALGYSLADRNQKLPEAFKLISKAHQLSPKDGFILDSLGWVNFRMGKNDLALEQLQQAFSMKPEADIAAHIGEVLWVMNRSVEAEDMWRKGQQLDANNPTLKETLKRLKPDWSLADTTLKGAWDGRFSVKITGLTESKNQGGSGGFTLTQDALIDVLEIRNPVGGSIAKITIKPGEAILERDGQLTSAVDADTLIQNTLGLPLPARGLSDWLRGKTRPGGNASVERNAKGQVSKITQDGWTLNYNWNNAQRLEKLMMTRSSNIGSIDIRLVFDNPNE
ncbi:Outer membrane lipoprotein involved in outer membrane biogenesis [Polynucleobacter duraquae]|jgi:outer membrane biogenesis lipoprotein LolB|uniref:Outer-membrane lipoprotein LolB n=1 Tax=Polynucleobacter duraquae TaxID=1835254 RepID=A0A0E3ZNA3_9BURK|nr:lipoprotein insertase outer membrane protein LolB [Polynucleobacter duraquae]AKD26236.1 Outer membrane lipoprotein involved in outer membrane biogenesis [Polynucleobacter duraquae]